MLQQNEAYRKEFLQNLAHEFKTPIFAIQGYVDTLLDGVGEEAIRKRFLENTAKNVDRLVNLMNDLDEISKAGTGRTTTGQTKLYYSGPHSRSIRLAIDKNTGKNIRTVVKKGCEAPITVFADKEKVKQVLINLVENATKYGKQNGNIVASIYDTDDQHVLVEISDDGIGIEEEHLPRIFERFYRTDTARSRDKGGTGLGLAICKHIIEAHGQKHSRTQHSRCGHHNSGFTVEAKRD